jgi:hypothetical protein
MNHVLLVQPHLIQTDESWQLSSENVSVQAVISTPHTSNQNHEAVLPDILRFVHMEREPLPIMEPKVQHNLALAPVISHTIPPQKTKCQQNILLSSQSLNITYKT